VPDTQARAPPAVPSLLSRLGGVAAIAGSTNLRPGAASALSSMLVLFSLSFLSVLFGDAHGIFVLAGILNNRRPLPHIAAC